MTDQVDTSPTPTDPEGHPFRPQPWVAEALVDVDRTLTEYATKKAELNADGQGEERARYVDELLDTRSRYVAHLRDGKPL